MKLVSAVAVATALFVAASPVSARRTAIDSNGPYTIGGYCDLNGDECNPVTDGIRLPYLVRIGSDGFTNKVFVHGDGLLTFGAPVDFSALRSVLTDGNPSNDPALSQYANSVISGGLDNSLTGQRPGSNVLVFAGQGSVSYDQGSDTIDAYWTQQQNGGVFFNSRHLQLSRASGGFNASLILEPDQLPDGYADPAFVIDGVTTAITPAYDDETGQTVARFFIPATFADLPAAVPEPASWAMMIGGVGFAGGALRRSRRVKVAYA